MRYWLLNAGKIEHFCTFSGHTSTVLCVDICKEYQIVVSGSADYSVCCWDILSGKLLHCLDRHEDPVVSVSCNSISGNIAALTTSCLFLYTINGELVAKSAYSSGLVGETTSIVTGRIVTAPGSADWQDGVVAVTGHDNGQIVLWRVKREIVTTAVIDTESVPIVTVDGKAIAHSSVEDRALPSTATIHPSKKRIERKLIPTVLPKAHRSQITALRLCSLATTTGSLRRDMIEKSYISAGCMELISGDADGNVSRWNTVRLDQYTSSDLLNIVATNKSIKARVDMNSLSSSGSNSARGDWEPGSRISNITRSATLLLGRNKSDSIASRSSLSLSPSAQSEYSDYSSSEPTTPY